MLTRRALCKAVVAAAALQTVPRVSRADDPLIAVLVSDSTSRTGAVVRTFKAGVGSAQIMICDCSSEADAGAFIADNLRGVPVSLVFAVGDVALRVALREFSQTPVVWADAVDNAAAALHLHTTGVSPRLDATTVFARFKTLKPDLAAVGIMRATADTDPYWDAVAAAAKSAGLRLVAPTLGSSAEVSNAFKGLVSGADLTWIQPDPTLWTGAVLAGLFHEATISHHLVVGFDRAQLQGAQPPPMVAESDPEAMGKQAAEMAKGLMAGTAPAAQAGYAAPVLVGKLAGLRGAGVLVNKKSAAAIDVWLE